jgi:hypothetical protein
LNSGSKKTHFGDHMPAARHLARAVGDPLPGINAFAAPVFDHEGAVVLSVTAMGPESSFDARWTSAIAKALLVAPTISQGDWDLRPQPGNSAAGYRETRSRRRPAGQPLPAHFT